MHGRASEREEVDQAGGHRARLRKRLLDAGPQGFHDYELLEYLLALTIQMRILGLLYFTNQRKMGW